LASVRRYAVLAILVLAAVVTPPDVVSQLTLFTVVYGLFEVSILLIKRIEKRRDEQLRAEGLLDEDEE
jgi:sec-independent protein translocase protein TatC